MLKPLIIVLCVLSILACQPEKTATEQQRTTIEYQSPLVQKLSVDIAKNPNDPGLYAQRGQTYYENQSYKSAAIDLERAIELEPNEPMFYHVLSDIYLDDLNSKKAINTLETAQKKFPNRLTTALKLTEFYVLLKEYGKADKMLVQILQKNPDEAEAYFMLGLLNMEKDNTPDAIKAMEKAVAFDADLVDAWLILAKLKEDSPKLVKQYLNNAMAVAPDNVEVRMAKANFLAADGNFKEAIELYRSIGLQNPQHAASHYNAGLCYKLLEDYKMAIQEATIAYKIDPTYAEAYALIASCYQATNNLDKAKEFANQALTFRDVPMAREVLENL